MSGTDKILIFGEYSKPLVIPIDTDLDLSDKVLTIVYESKRADSTADVLGSWDAGYEYDSELGRTAKHIITEADTSLLTVGSYKAWVEISDASGTFLEKTFPAKFEVQYAPTMPAGE
ncbi:MAG: hypothetical protein CVV44_03895 [Spirochaetae bacterium HGW-Spirochaetae-1]|jgi:hypothetical protein|nr:MAG: hypothetical protein CVV44_03895 [Spirochaetae bacterium HGW-Spirochaetae-1]